MRLDIVGDVVTAMRIARAAGLLGGPFGGVRAPPFKAGKFYGPDGYVWTNNTITLSANRLYRNWFFAGDKPTIFLGGFFFNSGVGDTGKKVRMGVWDENDNLKKDFGETILGGTSIVRAPAASVTLSGWVQVGLVADTTPALYSMTTANMISNVGMFSAPKALQFGNFSITAVSTSENNTPCGDYAAFTYGAMPDPITAATATAVAGAGTTFPLMGLWL